MANVLGITDVVGVPAIFPTPTGRHAQPYLNGQREFALTGVNVLYVILVFPLLVFDSFANCEGIACGQLCGILIAATSNFLSADDGLQISGAII